MKLCQTLCLIQGLFHTCHKLFLLLSCIDPNQGLMRHTGGKFRWKIFFYGYPVLKRCIKPDISNSKAAESQDTPYNIPPPDRHSRCNMVCFLGRAGLFITTMGTDIIISLIFLHASQTQCLHTYVSLSVSLFCSSFQAKSGPHKGINISFVSPT